MEHPRQETGYHENGQYYTDIKHKKVIQDPVHGTIFLDPLAFLIIDTPQFQRLHYIRQLGPVYHVYPSAKHSRFEHSIGVYHLAGKLLRTLQKAQPEFISDKEIICVQIAGLCHDLGHGPYSHPIYDRYLRAVVGTDQRQIKHEEISVKMFDYILAQNEAIKMALEERRLDIEFIKSVIKGLGENDTNNIPTDNGKRKYFLYEVIANKKNGIDVDKWDYLARDSLTLWRQIPFDFNRLMHFMRIIDTEQNQLHLCFRDKEIENIESIFRTRRFLHKYCYQHKKVVAFTLMICNMFKEAGNLKFYNKNNEEFNLTNCMEDCEAATTVTDKVFEDILYSRGDDLKNAREIAQRIQKRDMYKCVGEARLRQHGIEGRKKPETRDKWIREIAEESSRYDTVIDNAVIEIDFPKFGYGMGERNPMDSVWFYSKHEPDRAKRIVTETELAPMAPKAFCEYMMVVYCKQQEYTKQLRAGFEVWCGKNNDLVMLLLK